MDKDPSQRMAPVFRYLTYLGLLAGTVLAFFDLLSAAIAMLFAVACAHAESTLRNEKHFSDMEETLGVLMELVRQSREKSGSDSQKKDE